MKAPLRQFRSLRHAAWKTGLRVRGYRYRLAQVCRIVMATLEHLEVPADARVMEVQHKDGGRGLVVVIAWDLLLPTLETVALSRYVVSKIEAITGLSYAHSEVFFEHYLPRHANLTAEQTSSTWLRERIRRLTTPERSHRHRDAAPVVPLHGRPPAQHQVSASQTAPLGPEVTAALINDLRARLRSARARAAESDQSSEPSTQMLTKRDAMFDGYLTVSAELVDLPPPPSRRA